MRTLIFTETSLAEALGNVKALHDMSPELISERVFENHPAHDIEMVVPYAYLDAERAKFEACPLGRYPLANFERGADGNYLVRDTQLEWQGWIVRASRQRNHSGEATEMGAPISDNGEG
ncbi:hypothetical protein NNO07_18775 [Pseudomonas resinovorans]|uniref:Phage protein n=1 Tax=Metapseudomonas resinovorans TaxID=53412 RepID=A0ABT4Y8B8_METRE|nr:hypothetical protein [Pseudomonas resinovorans]MDA8485115.1 hypothetical protein [Pseudomonas resinovorans]